MSYVHCPACSRAYNLARDASCPRCVVAAPTAAPTAAVVAEAEAPMGPVAEIVLRATQLARALGRATPAQRDAARASLGLVRDQIGLVVPMPPMAAVRAQLVRVARPAALMAATAIALLVRRR